MKILTAATVTLVAAVATAQGPRPGVTVDWTKVEERIAWFGTWDAAKGAADRTGRPILLVAAAPHCHHVPGVW